MIHFNISQKSALNYYTVQSSTMRFDESVVNNVFLCTRREFSGDDAGSPLLSTARHQRSDHPAAPFHTACLQRKQTLIGRSRLSAETDYMLKPNNNK